MRWQAGALILTIAVATPIRTSGADRWHTAPNAKSRTIAAAYLLCAVRTNREAVLIYLSEPFGTDDPKSLAKALPSDCLDRAVGGVPLGPSELHLSGLLTRGLLFEALYERDGPPRKPDGDITSSPAHRYDVAGVDTDGKTPRHDYRALMKIGDCAVRAAPAKVRALLSTSAATREEAAAIADLHGAWSGYLPGQRPLIFSAEMMRATLAEPLYHLSQRGAG